MRKEHERLGIELSAPNLIMDVERQRRGPKMQFRFLSIILLILICKLLLFDIKCVMMTVFLQLVMITYSFCILAAGIVQHDDCILVFVTIVQVATSLNSTECFLLQSGSSIFTWHGNQSTYEQQQLAAKVAEFLKVYSLQKVIYFQAFVVTQD